MKKESRFFGLYRLLCAYLISARNEGGTQKKSDEIIEPRIDVFILAMISASGGGMIY
ncbi:hypothetical protein LSG25_16040 [Paralcaligenes sp. KSB-10]|uniref:hypothetical protein n=1 Tax=Paralcaligenes sp. KSB-10 TaxID=2901142 RepID=UPI001E5D1524|nr:hypothetical protein [Paralcaligenes sp. KSB-10]UHL63540.1 hypothetical protein LSG25_16040 [Paralcaligenes sp. KSB-10]